MSFNLRETLHNCPITSGCLELM